MGDLAGAARLFILPTFFSRRVVTLLFHPDRLELHASRGGDGEDALVRATRAVPYASAGGLFGSWEALRSAAEAAPSCSTQARDGTVFLQKLAWADQQRQAAWWNPDETLHRPQVALLGRWLALLNSNGLPEFARWTPRR